MMDIWQVIRFGISAILTVTGMFCILSSIVGVFRFKQVLSRMHSAALIDTVGLLFMLLGLMIANGLNAASIKMLVVIGFVWMTSPVSSHLISRMEIVIRDDLEQEMRVDDKTAVESEREGK